MAKPSSESPPRWSKYMRTRELSEYLRDEWGIQLSPQTLAKRRCQGGGVPFLKDGRYPVSTPAQADRFAKKRLGRERISTNDDGQRRARAAA